MKHLIAAIVLATFALRLAGTACAEETLIFGTSTPPNTHVSLRDYGLDGVSTI